MTAGSTERQVLVEGLLLALLAALGFSLKAIFVKLAYPHGVSPIALLALRMLFSLPFFLWVGFRSGQGSQPLTAGDRWRLLVLGCLGYYGASILDFLGLQYISAGLERLILFIYPTLTLLIGVLWQGRKLSGRMMLAVLICYLGIGFAFVHDLRFGEARDVWLGSALVLGSAVCYARYMAGSGPMIARLGAMRFTALAMLVSTLATGLHFALTADVSELVQPWPVYGWALAMALIATVIPVFAQSAAIRRLGSGRTAMFAMLGPILTIGIGAWWLAEPVSVAQLIGAGLVMAGLLIVSRERAG